MQNAHDSCGVFCRCGLDDVQTSIADVCGTGAQYLLHNLFIQRLTVGPCNLLAHGQHALVHAAAFREALLRDRPPVVHEHDVHGSIAYVSDHVLPPELMELISHGSKALREYVRTGEMYSVILASEAKPGIVVS